MMNRVHRLSSVLGAALFSGAAAVALAQTTPAQTTPLLDVKPGLWDVTLTSSIDLGGAPPMDTGKMTPAQKAKLAEAMKAMTQQHTDTQKKCITKEDLAKSFLEESDDTCTDKVTSNTTTLFDVTRTCGGERASTTQAHLEAASRESVKGTVNASTAQGGHQQKMAISFTGKWAAADCGAVKQP